jgi:hypothetical protein
MSMKSENHSKHRFVTSEYENIELIIFIVYQKDFIFKDQTGSEKVVQVYHVDVRLYKSIRETSAISWQIGAVWPDCILQHMISYTTTNIRLQTGKSNWMNSDSNTLWSNSKQTREKNLLSKSNNLAQHGLKFQPRSNVPRCRVSYRSNVAHCTSL